MSIDDPTVMGIDFSLAATGLAVIDSNGSAWTTTIKSKPTGSAPTDRTRRITAIRNQILTIARDAGPMLAVIEQHPFKIATGHAFDRGGLFYAVVNGLDQQGILVAEANNTHVKMFATTKGSGDGTDKVSVSLAISKLWRHEVEIVGDNAGDGLVLASMGAVRARHTQLPFVVSENRLRALAKVAWPAELTHQAPA